MGNKISREEIISRVNRTLIEEFELDPSVVAAGASIAELGLDSLDYIDMIIVLENEFSFRLEDKSIFSSVRTLDNVYDLIEDIASKNGNAV